MLPKKNQEVQYKKIELPECKKEIQIKSYLTKDVLDYLQASQNMKSKSDIMALVVKLIKKCVHPDDIELFEKLSVTDYTYLTMWVRSISVDSKIPYPHSCPHCDFYYPEYTYDYSVEGSYEIEINNKPEITLSDGTIIYFKKLTFKDELDISSKNLKTPSAIIYEKVKKSIVKIVERNSIYDTWTDEELDNYIHSFPLADYRLLVEGYASNQSTIELKKKSDCISCGEKYTIKLDDFSFFG